MLRAVKGSDWYSGLEWVDGDGALALFATGYTFTLEARPQADPSVVAFTKTSGITGADTSPNVVIAWATTGELNTLEPGLYTLLLTATETATGRDRPMVVDFELLDPWAPGSIGVAPWLSLSEARAYALCADVGTVSNARLLTALRVASAILRRHGGRYGQTTTTVRPAICSPSCPCALAYDVGVHSVGYVTTGYPGRAFCGCSYSAGVVLPGHVANVVEVRVDGSVLPSPAWHLYDGRRLVRADGQSWPCCQLLADPADFTVTYVRGLPPDELGKMAAAELACHLALAMDDSGECRLASNVVAVTRHGVSQQIEVSTFLDLPLVATFLAANPGARRPRPTIAGPDRIRPTRAG